MLSKRTNLLGNIAKNLALLFVTTAILLVAGEYTVRYAFRDITTTHENYSYFAFKWKKENVQLNSMGFRDREFNPPKDTGIYRILVIGDSFAFGQGIPEMDRFSNIVEAELRKFGNGFEVMNCGISGTNTVHWIPNLKALLSRTKPDFVLLQWFVNDVETPQPGSGTKGRSSILRDIKIRLHKSSALFFLLSQQWGLIRDKSGIFESYPDEMSRRFGNPESPESREAEKNFMLFMRLCREEKVPLGVVLFPMLTPVKGKNYPFAYLHERVSKWCAKEEVPYINLLETYAPLMGDRSECIKLWVNRFDPHPGVLANRLAADRIMGFFRNTWLSGKTQTWTGKSPFR